MHCAARPRPSSSCVARLDELRLAIDGLEGANVLKSSGRGVFLINELMDTVEFLDEGRRVTMRKKVDAEAER